MDPPRKVDAHSIRNYDELSPVDLIQSLMLERAMVNKDELSRAEWFWARRPRVLFESLICLFCYVVVFVCLLSGVPQSLPALIVWVIGGASCAVVEWFRLDHWRNEYNSSIKRLLLACRNANK
jgi:hypothetical protein